MPMPVVVMDEAGHTGENLLDPEQPVYALAAVRLDSATAEAAVTDALSRAPNGTKELKFSRLRKSNAGRKNIIALLDDVKLTADDAAIIVVHKPWMLAGKMIDELVEPRMVTKGLQPVWYASGAAKRMAQTFYELAPRALGGMYTEVASAFVTMVRDYTPEAGAAFVQTLQRCKIVCRDQQVHDLLSIMIDNVDDVSAEFETRNDALDPALTCLFSQGGYWSSTLQTRFEVLHDDSNSVRRWQKEIFGAVQRHTAGRKTSESFTLGEVTVHLPTLLDRITFEESHGDARLQIADILAGSATHLYAVATGARTDEGNFARNLHKAGVADLIKEAVGPE